ncbi:MAG: hypothetical protein AAGH78_14555 [Cyanobacteria bacterium P01_H01_bin.58]
MIKLRACGTAQAGTAAIAAALNETSGNLLCVLEWHLARSSERLIGNPVRCLQVGTKAYTSTDSPISKENTHGPHVLRQ